jgi:hypothetical protein
LFKQSVIVRMTRAHDAKMPSETFQTALFYFSNQGEIRQQAYFWMGAIYSEIQKK